MFHWNLHNRNLNYHINCTLIKVTQSVLMWEELTIRYSNDSYDLIYMLKDDVNSKCNKLNFNWVLKNFNFTCEYIKKYDDRGVIEEYHEL